MVDDQRRHIAARRLDPQTQLFLDCPEERRRLGIFSSHRHLAAKLRLIGSLVQSKVVSSCQSRFIHDRSIQQRPLQQRCKVSHRRILRRQM